MGEQELVQAESQNNKYDFEEADETQQGQISLFFRILTHVNAAGFDNCG